MRGSCELLFEVVYISDCEEILPLYVSGALEKRGVGALELVAMDMKTR
jgi:hypothetical protein